MRQAKRFFIKFSIAWVASMSLGLYLLTGVSHASLGTSGPPSNDFTPAGLYVVTWTTDVKIADTYVRLYYPATTTGNQTVTINHGDLCSSGSPAYDAALGGFSSGDKQVEYLPENTAGKRPDPGVYGIYTTAATCPSPTFTVNLSDARYTVDPNINKKVVVVHAHLLMLKGQNVFRVTAPGALVGQTGGSQFGIELYGWNVAHSTNYNFPFGSDCTITDPSGTAETIQIADPDNGTPGIQNPPFFSLRVEDITGAAFFLPQAQYTGYQNMLAGSSASAWYPSSKSGIDTKLSFKMYPNHFYRVVFANVWDNNTLRVTLPTDSIYSAVHCQLPWTVAAAVNATDAGGAAIPSNGPVAPGDNITFHYAIDNSFASAWALPEAVSYGAYRNGPWLPPAAEPSFSPGLFRSGTLPQGTAKGVGDTFTEPFTIPLGTPNGTKFCRELTYIPSSSSNAGRSAAPASGTGYCVVVQTAIGPPPPPTCTSSVSQVPAYIEPGGSGTNLKLAFDATNSITITSVTDGSGNPANLGIGAIPQTIALAAGSTSYTFPTFTMPAGAAQTYTITWTAVGVAGNCTGTASSAYLPFFDVRGGDTSAGAITDTAGVCTQDSTGGITAWNYNNDSAGGHPGYYGAGAQAAAYVLNNIKSFSTGINPGGNTSPLAGRAVAGSLQTTNGTPTPHDYSFANASGPTVDDAGNYGGSFASLPCPENYVGDITTGQTTWADDYGTSGTYNLTGPTILSGNATLGQDAKTGDGVVINLKVTGDVYIDGNILYDDSLGVGRYPRLNIFATGNIYVGGGVTELHGMFVAQGGKFATCASYDGTTITETTAYDSCNQQLKVYGAVLAKSIDLNRSFGTMTSTSGPAEDFVYTPELWLATPDCVANPSDQECSSGLAPSYDAFTSLPPVL